MNSSSPFTIDIETNNILDLAITLQVSTPFGSISKSFGPLTNAVRFESKYVKEKGQTVRHITEFGRDAFSFYGQTGKETYKFDGDVSYNYDRLTISKVAVVATILAPQIAKEFSEFKVIKSFPQVKPKLVPSFQ